MAADFPTLKSGTVGCWGSSRATEYATDVLTCIDGSDYRWRERLPRGHLELVFTGITGYDLSKVRAHWISAKGSFDETWGITIDGKTLAGCRYLGNDFQFTESPDKPNHFSGKLEILQTL